MIKSVNSRYIQHLYQCLPRLSKYLRLYSKVNPGLAQPSLVHPTLKGRITDKLANYWQIFAQVQLPFKFAFETQSQDSNTNTKTVQHLITLVLFH